MYAKITSLPIYTKISKAGLLRKPQFIQVNLVMNQILLQYILEAQHKKPKTEKDDPRNAGKITLSSKQY